MRRGVRDELSLVPAPFGHDHVRELQAARAILDTHPELARWVQADLLAGGVAADRERNGTGGEQDLRALVAVKPTNGFFESGKRCKATRFAIAVGTVSAACRARRER